MRQSGNLILSSETVVNNIDWAPLFPKLAPHIKRFDPQLGSSPAYITVPIANKGLVSYIYETELSYSQKVKQNYADKYIKALDKVNLSF